MSLSNIDKTHLEELCLSLNQHTNSSHNQIEIIKANHVQYARLKQIAKDMERLRNEALETINDANFQAELHAMKHTFKLTSGNTYYVYEKHNNQINQTNQTNQTNQKYLSLISPKEWSNNTDTFIGKYFYDYDKQFIKVED
jgi:hypothetical protein